MRSSDSDSNDGLNPRQVAVLKDKMYRNFKNQNFMVIEESKKDHIGKVELSQEFFKLASQDLKIYEQQLQHRL